MSETATPWKFRSRASKDRRRMSAPEQALRGLEIEVAAKATRRRFTVEYKRKFVREADGCKTPGAVGTLLRREGLYPSHLTA
jgi:transposase